MRTGSGVATTSMRLSPLPRWKPKVLSQSGAYRCQYAWRTLPYVGGGGESGAVFQHLQLGNVICGALPAWCI
jgi:hypothetical protein